MKSKAPLLLMEQMVMLLVFALAAALCLQAFVKSDGISRDSADRDRAVVLVQTAAETVRAARGSTEEAAEALGLEFGQGSTMYRYYDENWNPVSGTEGAYRLTVQGIYDVPPGLGKASVIMSEADDDTLFELEVAWQVPLVTEVEIDDGTAE